MESEVERRYLRKQRIIVELAREFIREHIAHKSGAFLPYQVIEKQFVPCYTHPCLSIFVRQLGYLETNDDGIKGWSNLAYTYGV